MAGAIYIQGQITQTPDGTHNVGPLTLTPNIQNYYSDGTLPIGATGAQTVTVPTWASGVLIIPNLGNTQTITLKGVTGDTGVAIAPNEVSVLNWPTVPPASFVLTLGGALVQPLNLTFF